MAQPRTFTQAEISEMERIAIESMEKVGQWARENDVSVTQIMRDEIVRVMVAPSMDKVERLKGMLLSLGGMALSLHQAKEMRREDTAN